MTIYQKLTEDIDRLEADAKTAIPAVAGKCQEDAMALTVKRDALSWDEAEIPVEFLDSFNGKGEIR